MINMRRLCAAFVLVMAMASPVIAADDQIGWNGGTRFENKEMGYKIKFGGQIQNDWGWVFPDDSLKARFPEIKDGAIFRRARMSTEGQIFHVVEFKAQFDFAGGDADFKDMWIGLKGVPLVQRVRVGQQFEPFGLEEQSSSKTLTFMERSLISAYVPSRRTGIMTYTDYSKGTIQLGVFRPSNSYGDARGTDHAYSGRLTMAPVKSEDGTRLLHLGASGSYRKTVDAGAVFEGEPENRFFPDLIATPDFVTDNVVLGGGEAVVVRGPFSLQGEIAFANLDDDTLGTGTLTAMYVYGSWILTGESRQYKNGVMGGVKPARNFDGQGGRGAWEVAARFSRLDLNDGNIMGGELNTITVGLNWYLNPYTRVMANYSHIDPQTDVTGSAVTTRVEIGF